MNTYISGFIFDFFAEELRNRLFTKYIASLKVKSILKGGHFTENQPRENLEFIDSDIYFETQGERAIVSKEVSEFPKKITHDTKRFRNPGTVLSTKGLKKFFAGQEVLKDVNVELNRGDIVLLRGDNGSGKTTLLNILTGNLEPDAGTINTYANGTEEHFHFPRKWYHNLDPFDHFTPERVSRGGIGRTWQEVRLFSTLDLQNNIALAYPEQKGENPYCGLIRSYKEQEKHNIEVSNERLKKLGLAGRETSSADMISLGQSKRVAIGMALHAGAKILFLDEPLAGLDKDGIRDIIGQLKRIAHKKQITLVIVEHVLNIPTILEIATKVWTLKNGKITVEEPGQVSEQINSLNGKGVQWITQLAEADPDIIEESLPGGAILKKIVLSKQNAKAVLEVRNLVVRRGKRLVIGEESPGGDIKGVNFKLHEGELAFLQAPNGWGKTTLFEALTGLIPIDRGEIHFYGQSIGKLPTWERVRKGIRFLQSKENIFPGLTVKEMLQVSQNQELEKLFSDIIKRSCSALSGGERQKLSALSLLQDSNMKLGLLDEPFSALDTNGLQLILNQIKIKLSNAVFFIALPINN